MNKIVFKRTCVTAIAISAAAFALSITPAAANDPAQDNSLNEVPVGEHAWLIYCNPTFRTDALGMIHYVYKKKGCEFGPYPNNAKVVDLKRGPAELHDMSTEEGIRAIALRIFPYVSQTPQRERWIADRMSEQLDRVQPNSLNIHVK